MKTLSLILQVGLLLVATKIAAVAETLTLKPTADMYLGSYYDTVAQGKKDYVLIGGWGDRYRGFWKFNTNDIPDGATVTGATLYMPPSGTQPNGSSPVSTVAFWLLTSSWNETSTKYSASRTGYNLGSFSMRPISGLTLNVLSLIEYWEDNSNRGFMLVPEQNSNNFTYFRSREYGGSRVPKIVVEYTLGKAFGRPFTGPGVIVTTIPGGSDGHDNRYYYSVDFAVNYWTEIIAAESGTVIGIGENRPPRSGIVGDPGNYVKINHASNSSVTGNYQTLYYHLGNTRALSNVRLGAYVNKGDLIGYSGNSGYIIGDPGYHLHFEIRYEDKGRSSNSSENRSKYLDGVTVTDFQGRKVGILGFVKNSVLY